MSRNEAPVSGDRRIGSPRAVRTLLPLVVLMGFFPGLMFVSAQQGLPQFRALPAGGPEVVDITTAAPAPVEMTPAPSEQYEDSPLLRLIGGIVAALVVVAALTLLYLAVRMLVRLWRDRRLARSDAAEVDAASVSVVQRDVEPDAAIIRRGIDEALRTIDVSEVPGDSIVAAWVGLEDSATDAGAGRAPNETPSEFTARIIGSRAGIVAEVVTLLELYEQVRFGGLVADERDRASAAACLRGIQARWR
jgi:hypothetical protein